MTMDEYIKWLEARIAVIGTELETLIHARKAIEMASNELDRVKPPLRSPEARRLTLKQTVAKKDIEKKGDNWQISLTNVFDMIRVAPLTSGEVINQYYASRAYDTLSKREKDRIYAVLSYLKQQGKIIRSAQGTWSVPTPSAALSPEASDG